MTEDDEAKFGGAAQVAIYRKIMKRLGPAVVRHRLATREPVGVRPEDNPPAEFVIIWLEEQDRASKRADNWRFWFLATVAVISAIAAIVAAAPVVKEWLAASHTSAGTNQPPRL